MSTITGTRPRLFGTDGIRAPFGEYPLDRRTVTALGRHLAESLRERTGETEPQVVVGGDTRESTPTICGWIAEGLRAGGADPRYLGILPTAGIAYLVRSLGTEAGAVVSASHNPYPDNGIKLIDAWGFKWSEAAEAALEARLGDQIEAPAAGAAHGAAPPPGAPAGARRRQRRRLGTGRAALRAPGRRGPSAPRRARRA
jgi:phosphoglucosamine mutase